MLQQEGESNYLITLQFYERIKFNKYIRPLFLKDKCECCGSNENLELHHNKLFSDLLIECLHNLGYTYHKNKNEYSKEELKNITYMMLGMQLKIKYLTLCEKCHKKYHGNWSELIRSTTLYKNKSKNKNKIKNKDVVIEYLNNIINIKLFKEEINKLKEFLINNTNIKYDHNSLGYNRINEYFKENNIDYIIISKQERSRKNKHRGQRYWITLKNNIN